MTLTVLDPVSGQLVTIRLPTPPQMNNHGNYIISLGVFARLSWNDGRTQNWMFTEMDRAASAGLSLRGLRWNRPGHTVGLGTNVGWISEGRRRYLGAGGIGFITGDGRLSYGPEWATELFYDAPVAPGVNVAFDYQFVLNPAYNNDRGPVNVFAVRLRTAF